MAQRVKEFVCNAEDASLIPGLGIYYKEGNGNPLHVLPGEFQGQRSLEGYTPGDGKESDTTEPLSTHQSLYEASYFIHFM